MPALFQKTALAVGAFALTCQPSEQVSLHTNTPHDPSPFAQQVTTALEPVLQTLARYFNMSFSVGIAGPDDPVGVSVVAGYDNPGAADPVNITTKSLIPVGSATKLYTAVATLQAAEKGLLDLDTAAVKYIDPFLQRTNGTTMAELWGTDSVNTITVRQMLSMQSGLDDYDDTALHEFSDDASTEAIDQTPYDYLHRWARKDILFPPGAGGTYSSINYVLLGLALAEVHNATSWLDFDQRSIFPEALQKPLEDMSFKLLGKCSSYDRVVHQFTLNTTSSPSSVRYCLCFCLPLIPSPVLL